MHGEWVRKPAGDTSVVFVHGILSSGETCWRNPNGAYWPELLKNEPELEALGIYVYTYQTGFASGSYSLSNVVDDLKERLFTLDHVADSQKLVFVCHSMGGIVVRQLVVERINDFLDCPIEVGLFLVASPSLGSDYAKWLEPIAKFAGHAQAQALSFSQDKQWLNYLDKTFINLKESKRLKMQGKELLEDKFVTLKKLWRKQVVEPFSGARYFGEAFKIAGSDHFSIAKPQDQFADQHRLLKAFIIEMHPSSLQDKIPGTPNATPIRITSITPPQNSLGNGRENQTINLQSWQEKLIKRLTEQLKHPELSDVLTEFFNKLHQDLPDLASDAESLAVYLVSGSSDRHKQVAQFLMSLEITVKNTLKSRRVSRLECCLHIYCRHWFVNAMKTTTRVWHDYPLNINLPLNS